MDTTKTASPTAPEADAAEDQPAAGTPAEAEDTAAPTTAPAAGTDAPAPADAPADAHADEEPGDDLDDDEADAFPERPTGVGSAASAITAAGLGLIALSGSWVARVIGERQTLIGQIESANATTAKEKIAALYGDAWHMTALVNGLLSALALLLAAVVLAAPAFGAPGRVHPAWVRSVSWAAVALGVLGVLLFGLMYFDLLVPLPTAAE
ncbi:hypothetical protein BX286_5118 [Streptomyces sp. 3211.6]|uniref:hypothetical protein n=1 Tax=Streptomyces sp. 3211.6 TaxID=1938845 RepID=UPI000EB4534E|nr:hypothetical protein [Streptomyces sp. 3211.6]RKT07068.1 hypothetical protein BX286_5118 [Streptomyces sp. 3211.6]